MRIKLIHWFYLVMIVVVLVGCATEKGYWKNAKSENTIQVYENFLQKYPQSAYSDSAQLYLEKLCFKQAQDADSIEKYEDFLIKYPQSVFADSASIILEKLYFQEAKKSDSIKNYENFLQNYPQGIYSDSVRLFIKILDYKKAESINTIESFKHFIKKYPDDPLAKKSRLIIKHYSQQSMRIISQNKFEEGVYYYIAIKNNTDETIEFTLAAKAFDQKGKLYNMAPFTSSNPPLVVVPAGTQASYSTSEFDVIKTTIELPKTIKGSPALILNPRFNIPNNGYLKSMQLNDISPTLKIKNIPSFPMSKPEVMVGQLTSEISMVIRNAVNAPDRIKGKGKHSGLFKGLKFLVPTFSDTINIQFHTDITASSDPIWLIVNTNITNKSEEPIDFNINNIVALPYGSDSKKIAKLLGRIKNNTVHLGTDYSEIVTIKAGQTNSFILIYPTNFLVDRYVLESK